MKNYQKAQMIAKNLPTGSYAAGCPSMARESGGVRDPKGILRTGSGKCAYCELAQ